MNVQRLDDALGVAHAAADILAAAVREDPRLTLGLPTGRTAAPFYDELAGRHRRSELDLSQTTAFNLDELIVRRHHPASFFTYMERHAWQRIGLDRARCEIPNGEAADPEAECRRYDAVLAAAGGLDLAYLGVGADGHIAYNLPGERQSTTHIVELPAAVADTLRIAPDQRPLRAITMGLDALLATKRLVLMATGATKASAIERLLLGPDDPNWPCTALREHPDFTVLLDSAAAWERRAPAV